MLNCVELMGRMVADTEYRLSNKEDENEEVSIARYRLAVERDYKEGNSRPLDYISCKAFGSNARFAKEYFHKGDLVVVKGRIILEAYGEPEERKFFTGVLIEKSYLAKKSGQVAPKKEMTPHQDRAGSFHPMEQADEADMPFIPEEDDLPPLP